MNALNPTAILPAPGTVAETARAYAATYGHLATRSADNAVEAARAAAYRLASVYPVADNAVEVAISAEAVGYAISEYGDEVDEAETLLVIDGVAETMLLVAAEIAHVETFTIGTMADDTVRLTW